MTEETFELELQEPESLELSLILPLTHIPDNSVTTPKIKDKAVTTEKIADGAVTTDKIANGAINGDKIAGSSINSSHIKEGAINGSNIATLAVTTKKIAESAVTTKKIADRAVTPEKLDKEYAEVVEKQLIEDIETSEYDRSGVYATFEQGDYEYNLTQTPWLMEIPSVDEFLSEIKNLHYTDNGTTAELPYNDSPKYKFGENSVLIMLQAMEDYVFVVDERDAGKTFESVCDEGTFVVVKNLYIPKAGLYVFHYDDGRGIWCNKIEFNRDLKINEDYLPYIFNKGITAKDKGKFMRVNADGEWAAETVELSDASVTTSKLADGAVTLDKIADDVTVKELDPDFFSAWYNASVNQDVTNEGFRNTFITLGNRVKLLEKNSTSSVTDGSVTTSKIADGAVTPEKLDRTYLTEHQSLEGYATEEYVDESLNFEEIDLPEDFEGYTDIIHLSGHVQKDWSKVKIWSADDGIIYPSSGDLIDFDTTQIEDINYVAVENIPAKLDLSLLDEKAVFSAVLCVDEQSKSAFVFQFANVPDSKRFIAISPLNDGSAEITWQYFTAGETNESFDFTAPTDGWYVLDYDANTVTEVPEENLSAMSGNFSSFKFIDLSPYFPSEELEEMGVSDTSTDTVVELILKNMMTVYYQPGYYLADTSTKYATKEDVAEINERLNTLVPKSWADVQQIVRSGQASQVFSVGDQLICSKNGVAHVWDVIGFDVDTPINPNYTHSMTLQLNTLFEYRAFDDDSNDYSISSVREYLNGDYLTGFDEDFLSVLGGIRKSDLLYNTDEESTEDDTYPENEIFFLLSTEEVSTSPYEFYSSAEADPTIRIKSTGASGIGLANWRLRTGSEVATVSKIINTTGAIIDGTITKASFFLAPACVIF